MKSPEGEKRLTLAALAWSLHYAVTVPTWFFDKKKITPKAYEATGFPLSLLIKNGKIIKRYVGSFDDTNSDALIDDIKRALK